MRRLDLGARLLGRLAARGRLAAWLLSVVVLVGLRAVSCATPPEPLWIAGVYDGGDFDDRIELVRHVAGTPDACDVPAVVVPAQPSADRVRLPDPSRLPSTAVTAVTSRAPPAA